MIWTTVSSQSCFCWLYRAAPSLAAKNIINLISVLTIWWCPCVESSLVLAGTAAAQHWSGCEEKPQVQGQRGPSKRVGGANSYLESNLITTRDTQRAQTLCAPVARDPTETETELCLSISCGGMSQQWTDAGARLWVQQTWVWHKPSWRRSSLTPPQSCQNLHRTGK